MEWREEGRNKSGRKEREIERDGEMSQRVSAIWTSTPHRPISSQQPTGHCCKLRPLPTIHITAHRPPGRRWGGGGQIYSGVHISYQLPPHLPTCPSPSCLQPFFFFSRKMPSKECSASGGRARERAAERKPHFWRRGAASGRVIEVAVI